METHEITKWVHAGKYLLVPNETDTLQGHELDLLWYEIMVHGIMKIKLTGNLSANETDKRTNHSLSEMSPIVI